VAIVVAAAASTAEEAEAAGLIVEVIEAVAVDRSVVREMEDDPAVVLVTEAGLAKEVDPGEAKVDHRTVREEDAPAKEAGLAKEADPGEAKVDHQTVREEDAPAKEAGPVIGVQDMAVDLATDPATSEADAVQTVSVVRLAPTVHEELKVLAGRPVGAGQDMMVDGVVELREDRRDGTEEAGTTDTGRGDHPVGTGQAITQDMAQTSVQVGVPVGCLSQLPISFRSQFRSQTAAGAIIPTDRTSTEAQIPIMALKLSTTRAVMI
jgi:hypothetical protein